MPVGFTTPPGGPALPASGLLRLLSAAAISLLAACGGSTETTPAATSPTSSLPVDGTPTISACPKDAFLSNVTASCNATHLVVEADGVPTHGVAPAPAPQPEAKSYRWEIPLNPTVAASTTALPASGPIGIAIDGVPFYVPVEGVGGADPVATGLLDTCGGHTNCLRTYHYHAGPTCLVGGSESALLGFAFDGFPIVGPEDETGAPVTGLDSCGGKVGADGIYRYHVQADRPYILGCYAGTPNAAMFATEDLGACDEDTPTETLPPTPTDPGRTPTVAPTPTERPTPTSIGPTPTRPTATPTRPEGTRPPPPTPTDGDPTVPPDDTPTPAGPTPPAGDCETDNDCAGQCPAGSLGCTCFADPGLGRSVCAPTCADSPDCPEGSGLPDFLCLNQVCQPDPGGDPTPTPDGTPGPGGPTPFPGGGPGSCETNADCEGECGEGETCICYADPNINQSVCLVSCEGGEVCPDRPNGQTTTCTDGACVPSGGPGGGGDGTPGPGGPTPIPGGGGTGSCDNDDDCVSDCQEGETCICYADPNINQSVCLVSCEGGGDCPDRPNGQTTTCTDGACVPGGGPGGGGDGTPGPGGPTPIPGGGGTGSCDNDADCVSDCQPGETCICYADPNINQSVCLVSCEGGGDCPDRPNGQTTTCTDGACVPGGGPGGGGDGTPGPGGPTPIPGGGGTGSCDSDNDCVGQCGAGETCICYADPNINQSVCLVSCAGGADCPARPNGQTTVCTDDACVPSGGPGGGGGDGTPGPGGPTPIPGGGGAGQCDADDDCTGQCGAGEACVCYYDPNISQSVCLVSCENGETCPTRPNGQTTSCTDGACVPQGGGGPPPP